MGRLLIEYQWVKEDFVKSENGEKLKGFINHTGISARQATLYMEMNREKVGWIIMSKEPSP